MLNSIVNNPYRTLGVLSNSPLRDRVGNQNRLAAFVKVGREVVFPYDFEVIITEKPTRSIESVSAANSALNLGKDQLRHALFWFIKGSQIDEIALNHLQTGNLEKARELFEKRETYSSLINVGVLNLISGNYSSGFSNISAVIHDKGHRTDLLKALGLENLTMTEDEISSMFIKDLLSETHASTLLAAATNPTDKKIIGQIAIDEPISAINQAITIAKSVNQKDSQLNLQAGRKLMDSTKTALKQVKEIAGAKSAQYQMVADNLAKQILQCGINYYNNAASDDVESPRKAMVLQEYALKIAVGQLTKQRCQENYDILKRVVDNMPPAEVALEARKIKDELRKFCSQPDKISYSISLLNNTRPLLQIIKTKLGATNTFYLSLSTQVVGNALHNLIEEVNQVQNNISSVIAAAKKAGLDVGLLNYMNEDYSPARIIETKLKPVLREAWRATVIMDTFDMESEFRTKRYNQNRASLKQMCDDLHIPTTSTKSMTAPIPVTRPISNISTSTSTTSRTPNPSSSSSNSSNNEEKNENGCISAIIAFIGIGLIAGVICEANDGDFFAGFFISGVIVLLFSRIFFK